MANEMAFISQPMSGLTENEILAIRDKAKRYLASHGYQVIDSYNAAPSGAKNGTIRFLFCSFNLLLSGNGLPVIPKVTPRYARSRNWSAKQCLRQEWSV